VIDIERVLADDPRVVPLIERHVRLMDDSTEDPDACHRLDLSGLLAPHITCFAGFAPDAGHLAVGIGAYAHFGDWGEVKSMHVAAEHRGRGISRLVLDAIEQAAREQGASILKLETGATFEAALALYERSGFEPCDRFGEYPDHPFSRFMQKAL
jgi:putative acetyltransferase